MRREYKNTVWIGFGFFAVCVMWAVYNTYVPLILNTFITSTFWIGLVTALMNALGTVLHPFFGALSDKTNMRLGKRMPFLLAGIPLSIVTLALVPAARQLAGLLILLAGFNAAMSVWRTPSFALIADLTPPHLRSQANGVVNFMGGLGSLVAFGAGGILFNLGGTALPFLSAAVIAFIALILMKLGIRESPVPVLQDMHEQNTGQAADKPDGADIRNTRRSLFAVLCSLLLYSAGISAVETYFSLYATTSLTDAAGNPFSGGEAGFLMGVFSLSFMLFSIPAGFIATRLGRKKTILFGLAGISALFISLYFIKLPGLLLPVLIAGGVCCASVNINFLPAVTALTQNSSFGKYTGYYHLITFGSTIVSPLLFGLARDCTGTYEVLFLYSGIAFFAAAVPLLFAAKGHNKIEAKVKKTPETC